MSHLDPSRNLGRTPELEPHGYLYHPMSIYIQVTVSVSVPRLSGMGSPSTRSRTQPRVTPSPESWGREQFSKRRFPVGFARSKQNGGSHCADALGSNSKISQVSKPIPGHSLTPAAKLPGSAKTEIRRGGQSSTVMLNIAKLSLACSSYCRNKRGYRAHSPVGSKIQSS